MGSADDTICAYFVPSVDPATQFVPFCVLGGPAQRTLLSFFHFAFCVRNCVGGPGSTDIRP